MHASAPGRFLHRTCACARSDSVQYAVSSVFFFHTLLACRHLLRPLQLRMLCRSVQAQGTLERSRHAQPSATGHGGRWLLLALACVGAALVMLQAAPAEALGSMRAAAGESARSRGELSCGAHHLKRKSGPRPTPPIYSLTHPTCPQLHPLPVIIDCDGRYRANNIVDVTKSYGSQFCLSEIMFERDFV
jgi:hypothetical protein